MTHLIFTMAIWGKYYFDSHLKKWGNQSTKHLWNVSLRQLASGKISIQAQLI